MDWRMVGRRVDRRELIYTLRKTVGHIDSQLAVLVCGRVDAFKEHKHGRVGDGR